MSRRGGPQVAVAQGAATTSIATDKQSVSPTAQVLRQARQAMRQAQLESEWAALQVGACRLCGETYHRIDHRVLDAGAVVQLRRRRAASDRLVPLSDGRRDPLGPTSDGAA